MTTPGSDAAPQHYCIDGARYGDVRFRVGAYPAFAKDAAVAEALATAAKGHQHVVVRGKLTDDISKRVSLKQAACAPYQAMQMRFDWGVPEGGFNTSLALLARSRYLEVSEVVATDIVTTKNEDDKLHITVNHKLPQTLKLTIIAHYEGGKGKPSPHEIKREVEVPTTGATVTVPNSITQPRGLYRFRAVILNNRDPSPVGLGSVWFPGGSERF